MSGAANPANTTPISGPLPPSVEAIPPVSAALQSGGRGFGAGTPGGKGGGQNQPAANPAATSANTTPMSAMQPQTTAPQQGNVFQQAAGAQSQAQRTLTGLANMQAQPMMAAQIAPTATMGAARLGPVERMQAVGQVADINAPGMIDVNQLATTDLGAYMNPYTQSVIEAGQSDIERQRQLASRQMGARAAAAGAFGGSRQGVQEGILAGEALREAANLSAQQRQRGFETALQAGQFDIGQMQAARTLASQQTMQANTLNQQAAEAAAAREQAARAGNMAAANQFAAQQAQFEQQARQANMAAQNAQAQAQAQMQQAANQANFGGQFQVAGQRAGAAGQLAGLGQQMFGQGQSITQQQQAFGQQQQALNQALLDAARGQYGGFVGAPQQSLNLPIQAVTAGNMGQGTQTGSYSPGLFDYLALGASTIPFLPSDRRLKENLNKVKETGGVTFYSWDWNAEGRRVADPEQPTVGVIADELQETRPHLVHRGSDGYLRVDYAGLLKELEAA